MEFHWGTVLRFLMRLMPVLGVGFILETCTGPTLLLNPITFQLYSLGYSDKSERRPLIPHAFSLGIPREAVLARLKQDGFTWRYENSYAKSGTASIACGSEFLVEVTFDADNRLRTAEGTKTFTCL